MDKHTQCFACNLASGCAASPSSYLPTGFLQDPWGCRRSKVVVVVWGSGGKRGIGTQWEFKGLRDCLVKIYLVTASEAYTRALMSPHWASSLTGLPTLAHAP